MIWNFVSTVFYWTFFATYNPWEEYSVDYLSILFKDIYVISFFF